MAEDLKFDEKKNNSRALMTSFILHGVVLFLVGGIVIINPLPKQRIFRAVIEKGGGGKGEAPAWQQKPVAIPEAKPMEFPKRTETKVKTVNIVFNKPPEIPEKLPATFGLGVKRLDVTGEGGGAGGGAGTGVGYGAGPGIGIYAGRNNRMKMAKKYGGTYDTELAVDKGLEYLYDHQNADGSWKQEKEYQWGEPDTSITGLALLAFLGAGYRVDSKHKYAATIKKAVEYIISKQGEEGFIGPATHCLGYNHCICTIALSEAASTGGVRGINRNVENALQRILFSLNNNKFGAWRYQLENTDDADLSVSGWAIMALKDAYYANIKANESRLGIEKALNFIKSTNGYYQVSGGSELGWVGVFCMALGNQLKSSVACDMLERIKHLKIENINQYYAIYYISLATFQAGDPVFKEWNLQLRDYMVKLQNKDGSFRYLNNDIAWERALNLCYTTAMGVLSLEVYYRYLPLYQMADREIAGKDGSDISLKE